jgi:ABC-type sugar transport system ATPase subunit
LKIGCDYGLSRKAVLEVKGISKYFPGVQALGGVDLDIYPGEVHAVVGENGAGKSTLMKVLTGAYHRDEGEYFFEGEPVNFTSIHQSIEMGISCIYQELTIVPLIDVAKNLYLGNLPRTSKMKIDYKKLHKDAQQVLEMLELNISSRTIAKDLSVAQHQMLEIGRAVSRNAKVIIMDEPTSSLTEKETQVLFGVIRKLKEKGIAIFYISHKLEEIKEISDRISVFRDGQKVTTFDNTDEVDGEMIIGHMIGRKIENYFNKQECPIGDVVLEAKGLTREGFFKDVSFNVRKGEVLGFFGLVGAGRSEVMTALFGVDKLDAGEIFIDGQKKTFNSSISAIQAGIGLVPEDRRQQGLFMKLDVKFNEMIIKMKEINKFGVIDTKEELKIANQYKDYLSIKTPTLSKSVGELSGGNQQKVVISKWLMMSPKVLILDEPTRGIDVGAKSEIYRLINELAAQGVAVIVISSELIEILGISDRIIAMHEGRITGELQASETNSQEVMQAALGGKRTSA